MRCSLFVLCISLALSNGLVTAAPEIHSLAVRQDSSESAFPTLGVSSDVPSSTSPPPSQTPDSSESPAPTSSGEAASTSGSSDDEQTASSTASELPSTSVQDANPSAPTIQSATNNTNAEANTAEPLPLPPKITPALSIAGVFLILAGVVYALIGVKNRWIHVFLSNAFLASLAVLVLIIYVMNPPVSPAIQGAYFVGVFMSGLIFGGGSLVFKEVTEGLGCLLGGFCLSMWFLTLKPDGLITNTGGKAIFIAVFCVVCWSFSFSHYTRAYGLMFSTSFSGSTAFVLGIDCFSRGGLKEFWVYLWALNDDIFPLNTRSYPITRGIRVQTIVIVLGTIIGMISQLQLWKVVQNRQKQRAEAEAEDVRRRDAVEEALGRHLERQNDRDRSEWEKRYGDRLQSKRQTVLWSEAHGDKRLSSTSTTEVGSSQNSESNESLEMRPLPAVATKPPMHSSKSKRHSNISVQAIPEVEEEDHKMSEKKEQKLSLGSSESKPGDFFSSPLSEKFSFDHNYQAISSTHDLTKTTSKDSQAQLEVPQSLRPQKSKPASSKISARLQSDVDETSVKNRSSVQSLTDLKRRSLQSLRSKSPGNVDKSPREEDFSESKEALVMPAANTETHSRASSVAATMDEENEKLDMPVFETYDSMERANRPPQIVISAQNMNFDDHFKAGLPPSPSALSDQFDVDPEELVRPPAIRTPAYIDFDVASGSEQTGVDDKGKSLGDASSTMNGEGLTKGALDRVPSQMSNVVLSYRTNEWAKHIATAEAPLFEEPEIIVSSDGEAPTHLADPNNKAEKKLEVTEKPPPLPSPVTSVAPSEAGVKVNPEVQSAEKALTSPTADSKSAVPDSPVVLPESNSNLPSPNPESIMASPVPDNDVASPNVEGSSRATSNGGNFNQRSFTDPTQQIQALPKAARRISNPMQRQASVLQSTPIHENYASEFASRPTGPNRTISNATARSQTYLPMSYSAMDLSQTSQNYPSAFKRTPSVTMHQNYSQPDVRGLAARATSPYTSQNVGAMRSETRLHDVGTKTHQPLQRNNTNESRRESLMADWRMQLANSHTTNVVPQATVDNRYAQQMLDWEADKARKEQERYNKARQEAAMDQSMRTQSMIEAHREVMRKMQSKANKKIT